MPGVLLCCTVSSCEQIAWHFLAVSKTLSAISPISSMSYKCRRKIKVVIIRELRKWCIVISGRLYSAGTLKIIIQRFILQEHRCASYKSHSLYGSPLLETNSTIIYNPGWLIKQQCENHANDAIRCNIISIIISLSLGLIHFQYYIYIKKRSMEKNRSPV